MRRKVYSKGQIRIMQFSARTSPYQANAMLNICDADLLGREIVEGDLSMHISRNCYGQKLVGREEAKSMLQNSSIINMVGKETISLSLELGIGSEDGVKTISDVPFLIVFKM